jgi:hypothetical protein
MCQNNPTCFGWILSKLTPSCIKSKVLNMSSVFRTKNLQDAGIDNVFFLEKSFQKNVHDLFRGATSTEEK